MSGNCSFILRGMQHVGTSVISALILLYGGMLFFLSGPGVCSAAPASAAVEFLVSHQDTSGFWSKETIRERMDTAAAIMALGMDGGVQAEMAQIQAKAAVLLQLEEDPKTAVDRILALRCDDNTDGSTLLASRNPDGGWGMAVGQQSDVIDTILAVDALLDCDLTPEDGWDASVTYLLNARQTDGFWFFSDESAPGKLELTARVVRVLRRLRAQDISTQADIDQAISTTIPSLRDTFRSDGRFSLSTDLTLPVSSVVTAEVYRTLVQVDQPALYADSLALLESLQADDGRWSEPGEPEQDIYTTATVLMAFLAVKSVQASPRADLVMLPSAILFNPSALNADDTVAITAIVFNTGDVVAINAEIAFFNGDPRSAGTQLGATQTVASLQPNGSAVVSVDLATGSLAAGPIIFVQADPEGKIAESDRTNNIASRLLHVVGLTDAVSVPGVDLFIDSRSISFNDEITDTVFLVGSPVVELAVVIANLGTEDSGTFKVRILDGTGTIAQRTVAGIQGGNQVALYFPWLPASGVHSLTADLDVNEEIAETDETNNSASVTAEVIGASCTVVVKKYENGSELEPPFSAYDVSRFVVATAYQDCSIGLIVTDSGGTPARLTPIPLSEVGRYQWNVINQAPGTYTVTATFAEEETGTVLDHATADFEVLPTVALRSLRVSLPESIVTGGSIQPIPATVGIENGSNIDSEWTLIWELLEPSGLVVESSDTGESISLPASGMSAQTTMSQPVTGTFSTAGRYTVRVTATATDADPVTATATFNLLPTLYLKVTNEVVPDEVAPLGSVRVRTSLRLTASGEASGLDVPVAITSLSVTPTGNLADMTSTSATVTADGIVNAIGENVPDGTKMAVYIPYGTIGTGESAPGSPANPHVRIVEIVDGAATIPYSPAGGTLLTGEYSVTIMEFHQYFEDSSDWFGKNIGNAEIFLQGQ